MRESAQATLYKVAMPMTVRFDHPAKSRSASDSLLLRLEIDGATGIGECAPRAYVTGETTDSVTAALRSVPMDRVFSHVRASEPSELLAALLRGGVAGVFGVSGGNNVICLLETALLDLLGRRLGLPAEQLVPDTGAPQVSPAVLRISQVLDLSLDVEEFLASHGPFHFVKIKASGDIGRDVRAVAAIRKHISEQVLITVDANMSWTREEAHGHLRRLRDSGADFVEEPLAKGDWEGLAQLRTEAVLGIMLDESVCTPAQARTAIKAGACDAFNVRVSKNGGPVTAARLIDLARSNGIAFQIGVQVAEVGPLINTGRALAFVHSDAMTVEAGQSDRFFPDAEMVVAPRPAVCRKTNTVLPPPGPGFGLHLTDRALSRASLHLAEGSAYWRPISPEEHFV